MVGAFPTVKLADCVDLLAGFAFKSQHFTDRPDDIPLVKGENVSQGCILWEISKRWAAADWPTLEKFQLQPGDVVVAMDRPWVPAGLKWAYIRSDDPKALLVQRCSRLRSNTPKLDQDFLRFVIGGPGFESYVIPITTGVNVPHISGKQILDYEFALPPLPVQQRIAGILSAYDELIENSQRRIKILEAMARALYREWFVHFRFPGHENHPRVASLLGEIPQGWEVKKLGEVANTFRGRSYRSVDLADEGGLPFLNLKCLDRDGGFRRSGLKRYTGEFKDIHVAKKGDIVMAVTDMTQERRIVARAALVPTLDNEFGIFSMDLVRIEPKPELPKAFLYSFLRYSSFADEVKQHANGANVLHLSPDRITDYRFTAPPAALMNRFAGFVAPVAEEIDTLANKIDNLRSTRDLLLPRLFSGQIDVATLSRDEAAPPSTNVY
jgi:type I restriction enzyme S subunit